MKHVSYTPVFVTGDDFPSHIVTFIGTGEMRNYTPERTCKRVSYDGNGKPQLVCSACGRGMGKALDRYCYVNYCPNCGAKVEQ